MSVRKETHVGQTTAGLSELNIKSKSWGSNGNGASQRAHKVARLSSGATVGAAIVEAEDSLEIDVCFIASGEALYVIIPIIYSVNPVFCAVTHDWIRDTSQGVLISFASCVYY